MTPARLAAVRALVAIERGGTTLAFEMERARRTVEQARDRGLLLEIVAGTLRWRNALDFMIASVSRRAVESLEASVRAILRCGAYQLRYLERVPAHAVVHESVEIARHLGRARAAGLVNAVLRSLAPTARGFPLPVFPASASDVEGAVRFLTTTLSHPDWLVRRWIGRYGVEAARDWCAFNSASPELTVRSLSGQTPDELRASLAAAGVEAMPARFLDDSLRLAPGALGQVPATLRATMMVQEEASQIVAHVVGARPAERVLDVCAAPGGKTIVIASDMSPGGLLVAGDRRPGRVALLRSTLRQTRTPAAILTLDAVRPLPFGPVFDRVLLDAPCSGLGTLRRDPDVKWSRSADDLERFATAQVEMARHAADVVAPGGTLVYATCSSEPEENELVVGAFLASRSDFDLVPADCGPHARLGAALLDGSGCLRTLPFLHDLDAFFAAVLRRRPRR